MSKSRRLIELMMLVNRKKRFTVRELAEEFDVSYRTMWRYLQELGELGVPLYSEPGTNGGYRILRETEMPESMRKDAPRKVEGELLVLPAYLAVGYEFTAPFEARGEAEVLVPRLWFQLLNRAAEIAHIIEPAVKRGLSLHGEKEFTYTVTVGVSEAGTVPEGMVQVSVPEQDYIRFTHIGSAERVSVDETFHAIFEWLQSHGYQRERSIPWIEHFDERFNPTASNNSFDIYIPVIQKRRGAQK